MFAASDHSQQAAASKHFAHTDASNGHSVALTERVALVKSEPILAANAEVPVCTPTTAHKRGYNHRRLLRHTKAQGTRPRGYTTTPLQPRDAHVTTTRDCVGPLRTWIAG